MCVPCVNCGKCRPNVDPGTCSICGFVNKEGATHCQKCGAARPLPPGVSQKKNS